MPSQYLVGGGRVVQFVFTTVSQTIGQHYR